MSGIGWLGKTSPKCWKKVPPGLCPHDPSMLLGGCEPPSPAILLHSLHTKKPFSHCNPRAGTPQSPLHVALGSSRSAASFPGETRWRGRMGEKGMWVGGDTLLATGPVNPIRAGRERPPLQSQVLHRHGAQRVGVGVGVQGAALPPPPPRRAGEPVPRPASRRRPLGQLCHHHLCHPGRAPPLRQGPGDHPLPLR